MGKTGFYKHVFYGKAPSPLRETRLGSESFPKYFFLAESLGVSERTRRQVDYQVGYLLN